jgi:hypothetical protein
MNRRRWAGRHAAMRGGGGGRGQASPPPAGASRRRLAPTAATAGGKGRGRGGGGRPWRATRARRRHRGRRPCWRRRKREGAEEKRWERERGEEEIFLPRYLRLVSFFFAATVNPDDVAPENACGLMGVIGDASIQYTSHLLPVTRFVKKSH